MPQGLEHKVMGNVPIRFRSQGERLIASTLDRYGIPFIYEPSLRIPYQGRMRLFRPDFYIPEQVEGRPNWGIQIFRQG